jgi:predicted homoserine dehydrogenase-like protein
VRPPPPLRVALFGASSLGRAMAARIAALPGVALLCVLDNDAATWASSIDGAPVVAPDQSVYEEADVVLVSSMHAGAIAAQVSAAGYGHKLMFEWEPLVTSQAPENASTTT